MEEIIHLVGLEEKRKAYAVNLSGGQRQRLALGVAIINNPRIFSWMSLPPGLIRMPAAKYGRILRKLREKMQTSMILTTHYMEEAEVLCDYIIIIDHGKILRQGHDLEEALMQQGMPQTSTTCSFH